jgi:hypothetical protein
MTRATIVVHAPDLMDQSRIRAALPTAVFVRRPEQLLDHADAELVIVDLDRPGVLDVVTAWAGRDPAVAELVGFGAHVAGANLTAATAVGVGAMARSRFFGRWLPARANAAYPSSG